MPSRRRTGFIRVVVVRDAFVLAWLGLYPSRRASVIIRVGMARGLFESVGYGGVRGEGRTRRPAGGRASLRRAPRRGGLQHRNVALEKDQVNGQAAGRCLLFAAAGAYHTWARLDGLILRAAAAAERQPDAAATTGGGGPCGGLKRAAADAYRRLRHLGRLPLGSRSPVDGTWWGRPSLAVRRRRRGRRGAQGLGA